MLANENEDVIINKKYFLLRSKDLITLIHELIIMQTRNCEDDNKIVGYKIKNNYYKPYEFDLYLQVRREGGCNGRT